MVAALKFGGLAAVCVINFSLEINFMGKAVEKSDIYDLERQPMAPAETRRNEFFAALLSLMLIVGLPLGFWMSVVEGAALLLGFDYGYFERLVIAGLIGIPLLVVWSCVRLSRSN